ncbi:hypothetical protein AAE478_006578 [Parahypoxylon ruwenzoriense]
MEQIWKTTKEYFGDGYFPGHYWKHYYIAFATIPDDLQIPPVDYINGKFRFLGHTWPECREGLLAEGVHPDTVKFAEMCLWREIILQYLEKVDPELWSIVVSKMTLMAHHRVISANAHGAGAVLLASGGIMSKGVEDKALEISSICHCLSLDMAKESIGVLKGEKTESVAGDRQQLKRELLWLYVRGQEYLQMEPTGNAFFILIRYASASFQYVPMMDRYRERACGDVRFPITEAMSRILAPYIKEQTSPEELNGDRQPVSTKVASQKVVS